MKCLAHSFVWSLGWIKQLKTKLNICLDHAGPVAGKMLFIIVDAHLKWIDTEVVPSTSASATIAVLRSVFATHSIPEQLVTDNGTGFASEEFKEFTSHNGIHHTFTSPYHPAVNGLAECAVQVIKRALDSLKKGEDITAHLNKFLLEKMLIGRICHHFIVGDKVYTRSYGGSKEKWIPATIIKITGPLSYVVKTIDNLE